jgi:hypothetical protein
LHIAVYFLLLRGESDFKGCTARIVPNHSAFRKQNQPKRWQVRSRLFEIARVLVRLDHVALADKKRAGSKSLPNQLTDPDIIILA